MSTVASVPDPEAAAHLLDPMRARILVLAREPMSASQMAERLGLPRQRVNYHVRQLAAAGLLREAGRRERRNLTEVLYVGVATHYLVDPAALGPLAPAPDDFGARSGPAHALATLARAHTDLARVAGDGRAFACEHEVTLAGAAEQEAFRKALEEAVAAVVARFGGARGARHQVALLTYPFP